MTATIAVVGPGAIGGACAAVLAAETSNRVTVCFRSPRATPDSLILRRPDGTELVVSPELAHDPAAVGRVDVVILATKAYDTAAAGPWLDRLCGPETLVAACQNGVDQVERIGPLVPTATVVPVVVQFSAARLEPGVIEQRTPVAMTVPREGSPLAEVFATTSMAIRVTDDFATAAWDKLLLNSVIGGLTALMLTGSSAFGRDDLRAAALPMAEEVVAVGRAEGARFADDAARALFDRFATGGSDHLPSIAADRQAGNPLEWEVRNAVVGRLGRRHGIPTPVNDLVTALLRAASPNPG